jgi:hypothetical protein
MHQFGVHWRYTRAIVAMPPINREFTFTQSDRTRLKVRGTSNQHQAAFTIGYTSSPIVRFVIKKFEQPGDLGTTQLVEQTLSVAVDVTSLNPCDPELARFRRLVIPGVSRPGRADLFEAANAIRVLLKAETVEPDVGTTYCDCECAPPEAVAREDEQLAAGVSELR